MVLAEGRAHAIFAMMSLSLVLADGRAIAIFEHMSLPLVLAPGRAHAIFTLMSLPLVLAEARVIAIFTLMSPPLVLADCRAIAICALMSLPLVIAEGRDITIFALIRMPLVLAHLATFRKFRHDFAATVLLARLALGSLRRAAVVLGRRMRVTLGPFRHSPCAVDRHVGVARITALAIAGGCTRLACADQVVVDDGGLCSGVHGQVQ